jgi:hypothetical protein
MGKLWSNPFKSVRRKGWKPLELIHSDIIGPTQTESFRRKRYAIFFTDDARRYTGMYLQERQVGGA